MAEKKKEGELKQQAIIRSLDVRLGEVTDFRVDPSFNEQLPLQIHCKSCGALLRPDWRYERLKYWHVPMDWCKAPRAFVVNPQRVLQEALRAVLDKAPAEPDTKVYDRLKRWVLFVNVEARSYDDYAVYVALNSEAPTAAA